MTVRVGTGLDEDAAVAVWQAASAAQGLRSGGTRAQHFRATLRSPGTLTLLAEHDGAVVGVLVVELDRGLLRLSVLAVAPPVQRTGVGTGLVQALLARYPRVTATAPPEVAPFLARRGFTRR